MPELPEVETIRRQIAPLTEGRRIERAIVADARWVLPYSPRAFAGRLRDRVIARLTRRGKYFVFGLDDGSALLLHLRMTGNLLYLSEAASVPRAHLRGSLLLGSGAALAFVDPRRFGTAEIFPDDDSLKRHFADRLGPEPFDEEFSGEHLYAGTRDRRTSVKAVLLDQRRVAGVGNIYADEALHRAGIAPQRQASRLTRAQCARLRDAVRAALEAGIDAKGASIDDFRDAYGARGSFQDQFLVHRREGLPCAGCGSPVFKTRVAGRGTYLCPTCQRR